MTPGAPYQTLAQYQSDNISTNNDKNRERNIRLSKILALFTVGAVGCTGFLALFVGLFLLALFVIKLLWAWTIPDLFPGAVDQGFVAGSISWFTAFKLAIFVAVFGSLAGFKRGKD